MSFTDFGFFNEYRSENPDDDIIYFRNESGEDFYDLQTTDIKDTHFFMADSAGLVAGHSSDISALSPFDMRIIGTSVLIDNFIPFLENPEQFRQVRRDGSKLVVSSPEKAEWQSLANNRIDAVHARFLRNLTGGATAEERDTWQAKATAAKAFVAGDADQFQMQMLTMEAQASGIETTALAQKIIAKSAEYHILIGMASALRNKGHALIEQAQSYDEVSSIVTGLMTEATRTVEQRKAGTA